MKNSSTADELPGFLRPFFWDVDLRTLSIDESSYFIISRLMEHGDEAAMSFLLKTYNSEAMIDVLRTSRVLSSFQGDPEIFGKYFCFFWAYQVNHVFQSDIRLRMEFTPPTEFHCPDEILLSWRGNGSGSSAE